jgi:hypothetical protein
MAPVWGIMANHGGGQSPLLTQDLTEVVLELVGPIQCPVTEQVARIFPG